MQKRFQYRSSPHLSNSLLCPNKQGQSLEVNAIHTTISTDNQASVGVYCPRRFEAQDLF